MKLIKYIVHFSLVLLLIPVIAEAQSAIGRKHSYQFCWPNIEYESPYTIAIGVHDQRPYVIDDNKPPTYSGTMRGGFGNPWDMSTQSGKPLSNDVAFAVYSGFKRVGSSVDIVELSYTDDPKAALRKLKSKGTERIVLITLKEFRSDTYTKSGFFIDTIVEIFDRDERQIGNSSISHNDFGAGDGTVQSPEDAARLYLSKLFNDPPVRLALTKVISADVPTSHLNTSTGTENTAHNKLQIPVKTQSDSAAMLDGAKKLRELKGLKDEGLLTEDEYEKKRKTIVEGL